MTTSIGILPLRQRKIEDMVIIIGYYLAIVCDHIRNLVKLVQIISQSALCVPARGRSNQKPESECQTPLPS